MNKNKCISAVFVILILIFFATMFCAPVFAQQPVTLNDASDKYSLGTHIEILEDKDKHLTIRDVTSPEISSKFVPSTQSIPNFSFKKSAYWVRFNLDNKALLNKEWLLEVAYPLLDRVEVYIPDKTGNFTVKKSGRLFPFNEREIKNSNFVFTLPIVGESFYYMRFESEAVMKFPLTLWTTKAFDANDHNAQIILGLYLGILLVMILYNLFLFVSLRDKSYLYYVIYICGYLLTQMNLFGTSYEYLWPKDTWWNVCAHPFFIAFSIVWGLKFAMEFLSTKIYTPKLHRAIYAFTIMSALLAVIALFKGTGAIVTEILSVVYFTASLVILLAGILSWKRGYRFARYFLIGWVILLISLVSNSLTAWSAMPVNFLSLYGMQIGSVFEVILFSLALADRINIIRREKDSEEQKRIFAEKLRDITKYLTSSLELNEVLGRLLESLGQVVPYDSALALLKDGSKFKVIAARGYTLPEKNDDLSIDVEGNKILAEIIEKKVPVLISDVKKDHRFKGSRALGDVRSWLVIPAIYRDSVSGIVILQSKKPRAYSKNEEGIVFTLASQAGVAIENAFLFRELNNKTDAMQNLLDNAKQGFLYFSEDLLIHKEYSMECIKIFCARIENARFPKLVFPDDQTQEQFLEKLLIKILSEKDQDKREVYFPLLPDELVIKGKNIHVDYKIINCGPEENDEAFMAILTDITDKRLLESQMEAEKNILKMVVKVVVNYNEFVECVKDYQNFYQVKINEIFASKHLLEDIICEVFRNVHTLKGNFSLLDMVDIVKKLHDFETQITEFRKNLGCITIVDLKNFLSGFNMQSWLEEDLTTLKDILGEQFFSRENVLIVNEFRLIEIEKKMLSILSPFECKQLLPDIRRLRYKPFKELLGSYPEYVMRLSDRLEKLVNPLVIEGGGELVDTGKYHDFCKSLVHVFRNVMDHGLEPVEERIQACKDEYGNIKCSIKLAGDKISVKISDDGYGIDSDAVRRKAIEKGIYDWETGYKVPDSEILDLIFKNGFTTRENANELSGRGVGLAAVKSEVDKIGGTIELKTKVGGGTEFNFLLPFEEIAEILDVSVSGIMNPLIDVTKKFFSKLLGETLTVLNDFSVSRSENMALKKYTTFTVVKGVIEGRFVLSFDESLARKIVRNFVMGDLTPGEENRYIEDALAECSNIILGNSIKLFPGLEDLVMMESPVTINSGDTSMKSNQKSDIWTCNIIFDSGNLSLSFVTSEMMTEGF